MKVGTPVTYRDDYAFEHPGQIVRRNDDWTADVIAWFTEMQRWEECGGAVHSEAVTGNSWAHVVTEKRA